MNKFTKLLLAAGLLALAGTANATPINGSIGFGSSFGATWSTNLAGELFFNPGTSGDDAVVNFVSGDYSGITSAVGVDFNDILTTWTSGDMLWDFTDNSIYYSMSLINYTVNTVGTSIVINGRGDMGMTGKDDTEGSYTITLNTDGEAFTWSSSAATPEPAITLLLATGLIGFGVARRGRKTA